MRTKSRRWIGVDGEGVGREPHRYVLLACSDGDYVQDQRGLSTVECLEFLLKLGTRDARVCGYYLGYDWTKILTDLADPAIYALYRPELRLRGNGSFAYVEHKTRKRTYKLHWLAGAMRLADDHRRVTVWDLGKYSQGPFVGCLEEWNIRPDVQAEIAAMKKRRANFTWEEIDSIRTYCMHECEALAEFATKLEAAHIRADLTPRSWYGPGSSAGVALKRHSIHELRGITPPVMLDPVMRAFFGGRAEISRNGPIEGPIHGYDISSAYPAHAAKLPCLEHGRWERVTKERAITGRGVVHALVHGHIRGTTGAWAPLPVRIKKGHIVFPRSGASGWWWRDEWQAARKGWNGLEFDHAYVLKQECNCKPFAFVPELFYHRLAVGKETGEGKVIKLTLNSLYGKLAQKIGAAQYASRTWAGMITSGTRAQVLDMMQRHKRLDSVLMIATDGLFSTEALETEQQIVLGGWEHKVYDRITLVRPGIYWLGNDKIRARGLGRDSLGQAKVDLSAALAEGVKRVTLAPRTTFGGAKLNVRAHNESGVLSRSPVYGQWHHIPTHVSLKPDPKRARDWQPPALDDVESLPFGTEDTKQEGEFYDLLELFRDYLE
jgi:DNA polymerase type B, organellar and viral